jgi:Family of unknown function (DUF6314)
MPLAPNPRLKVDVEPETPFYLTSPSAARRHHPPVPIADLAAFLAGRWRIDRRLDALAGAHFSGEAVCRRSRIGFLSYSEHGTLTLGGKRLEAGRDLVYRLLTSSSAAVYLTDGSFFHPLDLSSGYKRVRHLCEADTYIGQFLVVSFDEYCVEWHVRGPRKSYTSRSRFERLRRG